MKHPLTLFIALMLTSLTALHADDSQTLTTLLTSASDQRGVVTIPPGDYELDGVKPLPLASGTTVFAYGARFHLPKALGDKARVVVFAGENVSDFRWFGGHFSGHVFDPSQTTNTWEPNANTRGILITTTPGGRTANLTFRDITSDGMAGAVVTVLGAAKAGSDRDIETHARNVTVENCTLSEKRCQDSLFGGSVGIDFFFGRPRGRSVDSRPNRRAINSTQFDCPNGLPRRIAQRMPSSCLSPSGSLTRRIQLADRASVHGDNSRGSGSLD